MGEAQPQRILAIIIKNTSTIDFVLPIFRGLRARHPKAKLSILYCATSRLQILRQSTFYDACFRELNVAQYDMLDFSGFFVRVFSRVLRRMLGSSGWDVVPEGPAYRMQRWYLRLVRPLEGLVARGYSADRALHYLQPGAVLFDNRTRTSVHDRDAMFRYLSSMPGRVFLLPHAPHNTAPDEFTPFDRESGVAMTSNCEYWSTLLQETPEVCAPEFKEQFFSVGYPGLDDDWLKWLDQFNRRRRPKSRRRPLRCLYITRAYRGDLAGREKFEAEPDPFVLTHAEFVETAQLIDRSVRALPVPVEVIVKPHPANNFRTLQTAFESMGIRGWQVSYEPIYDHIGDVDFVVSLYSTILLVPAMIGTPTFVLNSRTMEHARRWAVVRDIYAGLRHFLTEPADLPASLLQMAPPFQDGARASAPSDATHLRTFFPDGAMLACERRILAPFVLDSARREASQ